nr:hypothetical protein [Micromonospora sp. DSM 115978]
MSVESVSEQALVVQRSRHGRRLAFYGRAADADYWDELWERLPVDYARARRGHLPRQLRQTFRRYAAPGGRVLEAGCGQAHFSVAASALGYQVEAVDWAAKTVERLRSAAAEVNARTGDVRRLDRPDG